MHWISRVLSTICIKYKITLVVVVLLMLGLLMITKDYSGFVKQIV